MISRGEAIAIRVTNVRTETVAYSGYTSKSPRRYIEKWGNDSWTSHWYNWCGRGFRAHDIRPGEAVEIVFHSDKRLGR